MTSNSTHTDSHTSVLHETRSFPPVPEFLANTEVNAETFAQLNREAALDLDACWCTRARDLITWAWMKAMRHFINGLLMVR
ncbi:MAG: hypothetical protein NVS3B3_19100 [Aquirhabdus sp.]